MSNENQPPVALIIGADDFIGAEIAKRFAKEGYTVCLGRRRQEKLVPLIIQVNKNGGNAYGFSLDARDEKNVQQVFQTIEHNIGPLEIVVFNIGANVKFPICETTSLVFTTVWEIACFSGFLTGREAAKHMLKRKRGSIFFTGTTASVKGSKGYAAFSSAKFGLRAVAQSMAEELGPHNIHVSHLIIDAAVETDWVKQRLEDIGVNSSSLPENTLLKPESVAQAYWQLHKQTPDAWTFEFILKPFAVK